MVAGDIDDLERVGHPPPAVRVVRDRKVGVDSHCPEAHHAPAVVLGAVAPPKQHAGPFALAPDQQRVDRAAAPFDRVALALVAPRRSGIADLVVPRAPGDAPDCPGETRHAVARQSTAELRRLRLIAVRLVAGRGDRHGVEEQDDLDRSPAGAEHTRHLERDQATERIAGERDRATWAVRVDLVDVLCGVGLDRAELLGAVAPAVLADADHGLVG